MSRTEGGAQPPGPPGEPRWRKEVATEAEALAFIDRMGFCLLFPQRTLRAASLWEAVKGTPAFEDWDEDAQCLWAWKDDFPLRGLAPYGKFLRRKPAFISLRALPAFLAGMAPGPEALETAADSREPWRVLHRALFEEGRLTVEARDVAEYLADHGPTGSGALRTRFGGKGKARHRVDRALEELQSHLLVTHAGTTETGSGWPSATLELLARAFPDAVAQAAALDPDEARAEILAVYRDHCPDAPTAAVARLFGWRPQQVVRAGW